MINTAGPKLRAYCPAKNAVSPAVFAIATDLVEGTDAVSYTHLTLPTKA